MFAPGPSDTLRPAVNLGSPTQQTMQMPRPQAPPVVQEVAQTPAPPPAGSGVQMPVQSQDPAQQTHWTDHLDYDTEKMKQHGPVPPREAFIEHFRQPSEKQRIDDFKASMLALRAGANMQGKLPELMKDDYMRAAAVASYEQIGDMVNTAAVKFGADDPVMKTYLTPQMIMAVQMMHGVNQQRALGLNPKVDTTEAQAMVNRLNEAPQRAREMVYKFAMGMDAQGHLPQAAAQLYSAGLQRDVGMAGVDVHREQVKLGYAELAQKDAQWKDLKPTRDQAIRESQIKLQLEGKKLDLDTHSQVTRDMLADANANFMMVQSQTMAGRLTATELRNNNALMANDAAMLNKVVSEKMQARTKLQHDLAAIPDGMNAPAAAELRAQITILNKEIEPLNKSLETSLQRLSDHTQGLYDGTSLPSMHVSNIIQQTGQVPTSFHDFMNRAGNNVKLAEADMDYTFPLTALDDKGKVIRLQGSHTMPKPIAEWARNAYLANWKYFNDADHIGDREHFVEYWKKNVLPKNPQYKEYRADWMYDHYKALGHFWAKILRNGQNKAAAAPMKATPAPPEPVPQEQEPSGNDIPAPSMMESE